MGLDMYLEASRYVGGWDHGDDDEKKLFADIVQMVGAERAVTDESPSLRVVITCAYWRKANAIHGWFVNNVQNGIDECHPHLVARDELEKLRAVCLDLLRWRDKAAVGPNDLSSILHDKVMELLPPTPGFFFGSTDIDQYFWADIDSTVEQLDRVLALPDTFEFEYQSSW